MIRALRKAPLVGNILWRYRGLWHVIRHLPTVSREYCYAHQAFAQFGEDVVLSSLLGMDRRNGFYVDVGAFHPIEYSNTYRFYKRGWTGINIEPNPGSFAAFPKDRSRDINLNVAVSDVRHLVPFNCHLATSGIVDPDYVFDSRSDGSHVIKVETVPLKEVLRDHLPDGTEIDFLTIDCEGHDLRVLRSNDWELYRPKIVLVEQHGPGIEGGSFHFLQGHGYRFYCKVGLTLFFLRDDFVAGRLPVSRVADRRILDHAL